ncbi:MAG: hypothetical protein IJ874_00635 [Ruminococcus sp.]|nr:hypothetical protein [Ruminococcus sp.]
MDNKKRTIQRSSGKKRGKNRPKIRFNVGMLLVIFILSFAACFVLYMLAANFNANFFQEEFNESTDLIPGDDDTEETTEAEVPDTTESAKNDKVITNPVPQSAEAELSYLDVSCVVTGSTLRDMAEFTGIKNVVYGDTLGAANCVTEKVGSSYGTITVYETLKIMKPQRVFIMLGTDIGASSLEEMMSSYTTLINNLRSSLPDMDIYVMELPPVMYDSETVTNELINSYNSSILSMADSCGVYCLDINTALKSEEGTLSESYWDYNTLSLNEEAYKTIQKYILTHVG